MLSLSKSKNVQNFTPILTNLIFYDFSEKKLISLNKNKCHPIFFYIFKAVDNICNIVNKDKTVSMKEEMTVLIK